MPLYSLVQDYCSPGMVTPRDQKVAKILKPHATEVLRTGDQILGLGTLDQLRGFRSWLESKPQCG